MCFFLCVCDWGVADEGCAAGADGATRARNSRAQAKDGKLLHSKS